MRDDELPEISVLDSDCLMAKKFGIFLAPEEILAFGDLLDPAVNGGACARKLLIAILVFLAISGPGNLALITSTGKSGMGATLENNLEESLLHGRVRDISHPVFLIFFSI